MKKVKNGYRIRPRLSDGSQLCETYGTKKEADARELEIKNGIASKTFVRREKVPLLSDGAAEWLAAKKITPTKQGKLRKQSTIDSYESIVNMHLIPAFGTYRMNDITTPFINKVVLGWTTKMGGTTIGQRLSMLESIFDRQVTLRTINYNPVTGADRPAGLDDDDDDNEVTPDRIHTNAHTQLIIQYAPTERDSIAFRLISETGYRHGEYLGMREVDSDQKAVHVVQQFTELYDKNDHKPIFTAPKTKTSTRTIPISSELASILTRWKLKNPISPYGLMFSTKDGSPLSRKATWKAYRSAIKRANKHLADADKIPELTIHSLRHRFASLLIARGTPIPEVSKLMGHSNPMITMTTYAHFVASESKFDANAMFSSQNVLSNE